MSASDLESKSLQSGIRNLRAVHGSKARGKRMLLRRDLPLELTSVDLGDGVDADGSTDVDVAGDGGAPNMETIRN